LNKNSLIAIRESLMISKTELAKKANISPATITRIENGMPCRLETQRKIILALGYNISDKNKVFSDNTQSFGNDNGGRRSGVDRRQFKYDSHIPEERSEERRNGLDRRIKPRTSAQ
jgi:DNA-binding XRE family transcriptional regulator